MPGYSPSAFGAATKVRIGEPAREMSTYSVLTTICLTSTNSRRDARPESTPIRAQSGHLQSTRDSHISSTTQAEKNQWLETRKPILRSGHPPFNLLTYDGASHSRRVHRRVPFRVHANPGSCYQHRGVHCGDGARSTARSAVCMPDR